MNKIFLDIETQNTFTMAESNDPVDLDMSIMCIYDTKTKEYDSFGLDTLSLLWPRLESTDIIVTFNGDHFDLPILNKYYNGDLTKFRHVDLLKEVQKVIGRRVGLDNIAQATLGIGKTGNGLEAITWWKNGEVDKIIEYCKGDVKVTKDVYEYAMREKKLFYTDGNEKRMIPVETEDWEKNKESEGMLTYSLPF
jgi:DEAD/DEAH box helicase domain-containing protein